ncbi:ABC transporter permease [Streptacidiphilus sp. N1-12]|uniref:ABC transporter permease n=2 Tax=Streptacidiphilus alkalitolerans TaxID=3342712 RepID=A0ABV6VC71_9ACTN
MSTVIEQEAPAGVAGGRERPAYKVTGARVLRSEWAKLWSLRSTWITLGLALVFVIAFGLISLAHYKSALDGGGHLDPDLKTATAADLSLFGVNFGQLALGVLGVLVTAGEYSTGMIRSTLAAVPKRLPVLWSKAAVYGVVAFVVALVGVFAAFVFGHGIVSGTPAAVSLSDPGVVRALFGAALYLALVGVIAVSLGALLRSVAGGISVLVASLMLIPGLADLLPSSWRDDVTQVLPSNAGGSMFAVHHAAGTLSPGTGLLVLLGWTVLALAGAAYRLMRTDA